MPGRTRPIEKFAEAVAKCSAEVSLYHPEEEEVYMAKVRLTEQSAVFGRCIAQDYNGVYKDKCLTEFLKLKDCYTVCRIFAQKKGLR